MFRVLIRRILYALLTFWLAASLAFIALRLLPGDAIEAQLVGSGATTRQIAERKALLGLDQPLPVQYLAMLSGLLRGDLGNSLVSGRSAADMISEQIGASLALAVSSLGVALIAGMGLGLLSLAHAPLIHRTANVITALLIASPIYWTGTLIIYFFSVGLRLPLLGGSDSERLLLPALVLGLSIGGSIARVTAASLADLRHADFTRTARAKGLSERQIAIRHVLRASLGPVIALVGLQSAFLLGGSVIIESLFVRPGIGQLLLTAIRERDYPVVQGIVILSAAAYITTSAIADVIASLADPRLAE